MQQTWDGSLYILRVHRLSFPTIIELLSLKVILVDPVLASSVDPDEMLHNAAFHLGLHCLSKYSFNGFQYTKGYCVYSAFLCSIVVL